MKNILILVLVLVFIGIFRGVANAQVAALETPPEPLLAAPAAPPEPLAASKIKRCDCSCKISGSIGLTSNYSVEGAECTTDENCFVRNGQYHYAGPGCKDKDGKTLCKKQSGDFTSGGVCLVQ